MELGDIGGSQLFDRIVLDVVEGVAGAVRGGPEFFDNLHYNPIPEPTTLLLLGVGLLGLIGLKKKLKK